MTPEELAATEKRVRSRYRNECDRLQRLIPTGVVLSHWNAAHIESSCNLYLTSICRVLTTMREHIPASIGYEIDPRELELVSNGLQYLHDNGGIADRDLSGLVMTGQLNARRLSALAEQMLAIQFALNDLRQFERYAVAERPLHKSATGANGDNAVKRRDGFFGKLFRR